jgi:hypothetical protein
MFGANAFAWPQFGQAYAGTITTTSFVDGPALRLRIGKPTSGWSAYEPLSGWSAGSPS